MKTWPFGEKDHQISICSSLPVDGPRPGHLNSSAYPWTRGGPSSRCLTRQRPLLGHLSLSGEHAVHAACTHTRRQHLPARPLRATVHPSLGPVFRTASEAEWVLGVSAGLPVPSAATKRRVVKLPCHGTHDVPAPRSPIPPECLTMNRSIGEGMQFYVGLSPSTWTVS